MDIPVISIWIPFNKARKAYLKQLNNDTVNMSTFIDWINKKCGCQVIKCNDSLGWKHEFLRFTSEDDYHLFLLKWG